MVLQFIALSAWLYTLDGILLTRGKHLHDRIISLRGKVLAHRTSLTPPLVNEVSVPLMGCERLFICVLGVSIWPLSRRFIYHFGTVLTVWYFMFFSPFHYIIEELKIGVGIGTKTPFVYSNYPNN